MWKVYLEARDNRAGGGGGGGGGGHSTDVATAKGERLPHSASSCLSYSADVSVRPTIRDSIDFFLGSDLVGSSTVTSFLFSFGYSGNDNCVYNYLSI